jgi:hypothetical protein
MESTWTGPVHSFRTPPSKILDEGLCLLATRETLHPYFYVSLEQNCDTQDLEAISAGPAMRWDVTFSVTKVTNWLIV